MRSRAFALLEIFIDVYTAMGEIKSINIYLKDINSR